MVQIKFYGWEIGAKKVSFIELLHNEGNIPLKKAKAIKDKVIGGNEVVIIDCENEHIANKICNEAKLLGIKCKIVTNYN